MYIIKSIKILNQTGVPPLNVLIQFQGTIGKNSTKKPGAFDMVGKYKWNAWNDLGDMSQVRVLSSGSKADIYTTYANG